MPNIRPALASFLHKIAPFALLFFALQLITRTALLLREQSMIDEKIIGFSRAFGWGMVFDASVFIYAAAVFSFVFLLAPMSKKVAKIIFFIAAYIFIFTAFSEWIFWDEFGTRFNFIAVDYLIYTQEVIGNIQESYPIPLLLSLIAIAALACVWLAGRNQSLSRIYIANASQRVCVFILCTACATASWFISPSASKEYSRNAYVSEAAKNGIYTFFSAFWSNEIDYADFYPTIPQDEAGKRLRELLKEDETTFEATPISDDVLHITRSTQKPNKLNVIMVVMESMSAPYMKSFGNTQNLTPSLDKLMEESLAFTNLYATGTRTVRGLEAVTLAHPPIPGNSIIRRKDNENLDSAGVIFSDYGYDTAFIYGGYGYFDNMNYFFEHNGFRIVDRTNMPKEEVEFGNVWGVSDEDLFKRVIKEADAASAAKTPFMHVVMTTSNHRPYTYPEGRIDIAPKSGRTGGVKYADYAVGKLLEVAKTKPWFKDTVFIFVADHQAGSSGKTAVDPEKYLIPAMFYSPAHIKPQKIGQMVSQIDIMPTLLGLLSFSYESKFYGQDALKHTLNRAFIGTYQYLGYLTPRGLTLLKPSKKPAADISKLSPELQQDYRDAIVYYQTADRWRENLKLEKGHVDGGANEAP